MTENASPFFIRPYRFDDPDPDDTWFPRLDWHRRLVLDDGEKILWQDRVEVAGHLIAPGDGADELAWTLPRPAEVTVTDRRLAYVCVDCHLGPTPADPADPRHRRWPGPVGARVVTGQIRWQWPARLRITPVPPEQAGTPHRADPTGGDAEQLLVVCDAVRAISQPALALSGGVLDSARQLRRLAILVRRAVAGFRLANPAMVELAPTEWDALLARAGMALFAEALADPRRGVDLPGALPVEFAHRDDYYRRSLRRRNVPAPRRSVSAPGANSSAPAGTGAAPGANSPAPTRSQPAAGRNVPASRRTATTPPVRWSARHPGSAS